MKEEIKDILKFYANIDNYWGTPLKLSNKYCRRTLHDVHESQKANKVLSDRGCLAQRALQLLEEEEVEDNIADLGNRMKGIALTQKQAEYLIKIIQHRARLP